MIIHTCRLLTQRVQPIEALFLVSWGVSATAILVIFAIFGGLIEHLVSCTVGKKIAYGRQTLCQLKINSTEVRSAVSEPIALFL